MLLTSRQPHGNLISLIKQEFFQAVAVLVLQYGWTLTRHLGKKARWEQHKNAASCFEYILEVAPRKTAAIQPLTSHSKRDEQYMLGIAGEAMMNL